VNILDGLHIDRFCFGWFLKKCLFVCLIVELCCDDEKKVEKRGKKSQYIEDSLYGTLFLLTSQPVQSKPPSHRESSFRKQVARPGDGRTRRHDLEKKKGTYPVSAPHLSELFLVGKM